MSLSLVKAMVDKLRRVTLINGLWKQEGDNDLITEGTALWLLYIQQSIIMSSKLKESGRGMNPKIQSTCIGPMWEHSYMPQKSEKSGWT